MQFRKGLTLIEVLVVIAIVALLIAILTPPMHGGPTSARRVRCMVNLKQQGSMFTVAVATNGGKWPPSAARLQSLCDQTPEFRDAITAANPTAVSATQQQRLLYCPFNTPQNPTTLWSRAGLSTWGYVWLNDRGPPGAVLPPLPARTPPLTYHADFKGDISKGIRPSTAELALDLVLSDVPAGAPNFAFAAPNIPYTTSHPINGKSDYVNTLCLDGHVEARRFIPTKATPIPNPAGGLVWIPNP